MVTTNFSYILKKYIEHKGVSDRQVAISLDIDPSQFNKWLNNKNMPKENTIKELYTRFPDFAEFVDKLNTQKMNTKKTIKKAPTENHSEESIRNLTRSNLRIAESNVNISASNVILAENVKNLTNVIEIFSRKSPLADPILLDLLAEFGVGKMWDTKKVGLLKLRKLISNNALKEES